MKGTPKSLKDAIRNGVAMSIEQGLGLPTEAAVEVIRAHVIDFMAQKFTTAMMKTMDAKDLEDLFKSIKGVKNSEDGPPVKDR